MYVCIYIYIYMCVCVCVPLKLSAPSPGVKQRRSLPFRAGLPLALLANSHDVSRISGVSCMGGGAFLMGGSGNSILSPRVFMCVVSGV